MKSRLPGCHMNQGGQLHLTLLVADDTNQSDKLACRAGHCAWTNFRTVRPLLRLVASKSSAYRDFTFQPIMWRFSFLILRHETQLEVTGPSVRGQLVRLTEGWEMIANDWSVSEFRHADNWFSPPIREERPSEPWCQHCVDWC